MTKRRPVRSLADAQAAAWYAKLTSERRTSADSASFDAWLSADPRHAAAFDATMDALAELDVCRSSPEIAALRQEAAMACKKASLDRRRVVMSAGLALAAAATGALVIPRAPFQRARYQTARGAPQDIALPDGTRAHLASDSALAISFSLSRRSVRLERGEVFLSVHHDRGRPLVVEAGQRWVEAVGTAFDVLLAGDHVTVTLVEGRVAIARQQARAHVSLRPGQQYVFDGATEVVRDVDAGRAISWTKGILDFDDLSLAEAVALFNRHGDVRLIMNDARLAQLRVGGSFQANDTLAFIRALELTHPVATAQQSSGDIILSYKAQ